MFFFGGITINNKKVALTNRENRTLLHEMQESLLILQNSYDAITTIIEKLIQSQNSVDQQIIGILQSEVQLTRSQIECLHKLIYHQLILIEETS